MVQPKLEYPKEEAKKKHTRTSRGRSKRGCYECRERHLKCDEQLPVCDRCRINGRICSRPSVNRSSVSSAGSLTSPTSPVKSMVLSISSKTAIVPKSLGNATHDPNGVFESIGSPAIVNMDSLIFWLTVRTDARPEGFAGNLTRSWVNLIQQHRDADPAVLSMFTVNALMVQGELTGIDSARYLSRALLFTIEQAQAYKDVTSTLLMVIMYLGSAAGHEGDLKNAETHFQALKRLYNRDVRVNGLEWIFLWGTDIAIATMLRRQPLLPWHDPPTFPDPVSLPAEEMSKLHRMAANNSASILKLIDGGDYLSVSGILQDLHLIYKLRHNKMLSEEDASIHAHTISLAWRTNTFYLDSKSKADKTKLAADICRQLLALALQSSAWHFTLPYCSQDESYMGEQQSFPPIPYVLSECIREILESIGGAKNMMDSWAALASMKSFVWISYIMALNTRSNHIDVTSPWISILYLAATMSGVTSGKELQTLLLQWPGDAKQVDDIVDGFVQHILSPSSSGLIMPTKQSQHQDISSVVVVSPRTNFS